MTHNYIPSFPLNGNSLYATVSVTKLAYTQYWKTESYTKFFKNDPNFENITKNALSIPDKRINTMFGGGSGTAEDPYLISNHAHLNNMRYLAVCDKEGETEAYIDGYFKVTNNIKVTNIVSLPKLNGSFYGEGSTITIDNLMCFGDSDGLFAKTDYEALENLQIVVNTNYVTTKTKTAKTYNNIEKTNTHTLSAEDTSNVSNKLIACHCESVQYGEIKQLTACVKKTKDLSRLLSA